MIKKTITYTDYNDEQRTEDHWFGFNKGELAKMALGTNGGLDNLLRTIIQSNDREKIMGYFEKIILDAYGEKSLDGKYFMKSPEISDRFAHTEAYSELIVEMLEDPNMAAMFIRGMLPKDMQGKIPDNFDAMKALAEGNE